MTGLAFEVSGITCSCRYKDRAACAPKAVSLKPTRYRRAMRRWTTLGAWARREAVLVSGLGAGTAIAALAVRFHVQWLVVVGVIVAAAGALARVLIAEQRTRIEAARERVESARLFRVPVAPVGEIDPTVIGVDYAAQTLISGGGHPDYVARLADDRLRSAVAAALDGTGPWIVVVTGHSKVGKSRSLFEALRTTCPTLDLVAPVSADAVTKILTPGVGLRMGSRAAVLWLDDLEPFLNTGVTLQAVLEWHGRTTGRIVAATYGGKGGERVTGSSSKDLPTIASEVLQRATEVSLDRTTPEELKELRPRLTPREAAALERHGLAAYLVAGPMLERKLNTGRHGAGDPMCPGGVAVVYAAVDWA
ncbi:MAG: hypothetical protein ACRDI2_24190, partial [Chloroflexota bacterium]